MRILKPGDPLVRKFTCETCGCVFLAGISEYETAADMSFQTYCPYCDKPVTADINTPLYGQDCEEMRDHGNY